MMILAAIALVLQPAPAPADTAFMTDPAFGAAHAAWARCTNEAVDAASASDQGEREIAEAAHAACAAEEAGTRAAMIAVMGATRGPGMMDELHRADRDALIDRVRARRTQAQAPAAAAPAPADPLEALISAWVECLTRGIEAAAATDAPERQALDAAFAACAAQQETMRRFATGQGGAGRANRFIRLARDANRDYMAALLRERRGQAARTGD